MVISAAHFKDVVNGYEKRTDGLWTHTGKLVVKQGPVELPAGSIGTSALAAGSVQQQIGAYFAAATFSSTAGGSVLTPITTGAIACSGALCRIEFSSTLYHSIAGGQFYTGLAVDSVPNYHLSLVTGGGASYSIPHAWVVYYTPPPGSHIFTVHVLNASGGTLTINPNVYSTLYVTEQKR